MASFLASSVASLLDSEQPTTDSNNANAIALFFMVKLLLPNLVQMLRLVKMLHSSISAKLDYAASLFITNI